MRYRRVLISHQHSCNHACPPCAWKLHRYITSSPNDPIFWLVHTGVDRIWWQWQLAKPHLMFDWWVGEGPWFSNLPPWNFTVGDMMDTLTLGDVSYVIRVHQCSVPRKEAQSQIVWG